MLARRRCRHWTTFHADSTPGRRVATAAEPLLPSIVRSIGPDRSTSAGLAGSTHADEALASWSTDAFKLVGGRETRTLRGGILGSSTKRMQRSHRGRKGLPVDRGEATRLLAQNGDRTCTGAEGCGADGVVHGRPIDHSGSPRGMSVFGTPVAHYSRRLRMTAGPLGRAALGPGGQGRHTLFCLGAGPSSSCPRFSRCPCEHPPASMRPTGSAPSADPTRDRRAARQAPWG